MVDNERGMVDMGNGLRIPTEGALLGLRLGWKSIQDKNIFQTVLLILAVVVGVIGVVTNFI